jgi:uncharacterized protein
MIYMEEKDKKIVWEIIKQFPFTFYAFGSRVTGKCRKFSDLDLFIKEPVTNLESFYINDVFEESYLPFTVDVVIQERCDPKFVASIEKDLVLLNKKNLGIENE